MMNLQDIVTKSAPILGGLIGGPMGSTVAGLIAGVFGGNPLNQVELAKKIYDDQDKDIKLIDLQNKHAEELYKIELKMYMSEVNDRVSARDRELKLAAMGKKEWVMEFLAVAYTVGFFAYVIFNQYHPTPDDHMNIMIISSIITLIIGYYFGSSKEK